MKIDIAMLTPTIAKMEDLLYIQESPWCHAQSFILVLKRIDPLTLGLQSNDCSSNVKLNAQCSKHHCPRAMMQVFSL